MKLEKTKEGKAQIWYYKGEIKKSDPVFYNPAMRINRDISSLAVETFSKITGRTLRVIDTMAATGIRGIRYALECKGIKEVVFNDLNPHAIQLIERNIKENNIQVSYSVHSKDASELMHHYRFEGDVVDVDPFGSAAYYLEALARCTSNKGMFMITFTDTAVLCGTYPRTALRRYDVNLTKNYYPKGELALRVAWKSIAIEFAKFDKGIVPLISLFHKHYIRVIGMVVKKKSAAEKNIENLKYLHYEPSQRKMFIETQNQQSIGKVWAGSLGNKEFVSKMIEVCKEKEWISKHTLTLLHLLENEYEVENGTYYEIPKITKYYHRFIPPLKSIQEKLEKKGYKIHKAHMKGNIVISDAPYEEIKDAIIS